MHSITNHLRKGIPLVAAAITAIPFIIRAKLHARSEPASHRRSRGRRTTTKRR